MNDAFSTLRAEVAYNCVYCGKPMYHRGDLQPTLTYAQCWECWAKDCAADRDKWQQAADRWAWCVPLAFLAGLGIGWVMPL